MTGKNQRSNYRCLKMERLERRELLAADVIISEFMADNDTTILDGDGDPSDWIELYNKGDSPQPLSGWHLTDSDSDLTQWQFPSVTLDPGQTLLVWASKKDLADPNGELHTNFKLSRKGDYLALVGPDGTTIVDDFSPEFPKQFSDLSYGVDAVQETFALVTHSTTPQVLVPPNDSLGHSWTHESFVPSSSWIQGVEQGVGYDANPNYLPLIGTPVSGMQGVNSTAYIRLPFDASTTALSSLTLRMRYDDGFVAYLNGREVVRRNAPIDLNWDSSAVNDRIDSLAVQVETIDVSHAIGHLQAGNNVLAIHGLNVVVGSSDFLIEADLEGSAVQIVDAPPHYFLTPTPGEINVAGTLDQRPFIMEVEASEVTDEDDIVVNATVIPTGTPVTSVQLHYRVMYGPEVIVQAFDDGLHGDEEAGDNVFGASIPAAVSAPGELVRYYVSAQTTTGDVGRFPHFANPDSTSEYLGTVIPDSMVTSALPIFQMFVENPTWFRNSNGSINRSLISGSFFHDGNFYDNIHVKVRGQSSVDAGYPNQKFKISFNDDNRFDFGDGREAVGSINLDNVFQDPSFARLTLGAELFREAGGYSQLVEPVQMRINGEFYSLGIFSERYKKPFLRRNGLPDQGALYESEGIFLGRDNLSPHAGNLANINGFDKDNREYEGFDDLQAFVNGISPSNPNREQYIYDNVNIPEVLNVLAMYSITKHYDRDTHNYFVYRDSDGTGEWSLLAYDLDLVWDRLREPVFSTYFSGHPFEGSSQDPTWAGTHWNRLIDAFADIPSLREMQLRRLRSLMDEFLQPIGTPYEDLYLENRVDELFSQVRPDAERDLAKWGTKTGGAWGGPWTINSGVEHLKQAFNSRRAYLYGLSIVPDEQSASIPIQIGEIDPSPVSGNQDQEFIELINPNNTAVDISGWQLADAVEYEFAKGVIIPANGSIYVTPDVVAFRARLSGPSGGQSTLVQGGLSGHLSNSGENISLLRDDGSESDSLTYSPLTVGPELDPIASQTVTSGQASPSIPLSVTDADTPTANLTFAGTVESQLYQLDQQLLLTAPTVSGAYPAYYENYRGSGEKYLLNPSGVHPTNQWYYLLPSGDFYRFTGTVTSSSPASLQGVLIASLGQDVYNNPALLHESVSQAAALTFNFTTGASPSFTITPHNGVTGNFVATITASDGSKVDSETFAVHVSEPVSAGEAAPELDPIASQTVISGQVSPSIPLRVTDPDTLTANLTFTAVVESQLYLLDQQYQLTEPMVSGSYPAYYESYRGSGEKYLLNPNGVHPTNRWYYLLPSGDFYRFTGTVTSSSPASLQGSLIASLGQDVYNNPKLLHGSVSQATALTFNFNNGASPSFTMTPTAGATGDFVATVTASDGLKADSETFTVHVNEPIPPAGAGDFDSNGIVDRDDFLVWESSYGSTPSLTAFASFELAPSFTGIDFLVWQRNFGNSYLAPVLQGSSFAEESLATLSVLPVASLEEESALLDSLQEKEQVSIALSLANVDFGSPLPTESSYPVVETTILERPPLPIVDQVFAEVEFADSDFEILSSTRSDDHEDESDQDQWVELIEELFAETV